MVTVKNVKRLVKKILRLDSYYRRLLESWLHNIIIDNANVLDIGGGSLSVKERVGYWSPRSYKILDNNLERGTGADFPVDLNKTPSSNSALFQKIRKFNPNVIFCLEVMEYVYDPVSALRFINRIMPSGGILYISFPSIYPVHEPRQFDSLRYTKEGICRLLDRTGFHSYEISSRVSTKGKLHLQAFFRAEKMSAVENDNVIFDIGYLVKAHK